MISLISRQKAASCSVLISLMNRRKSLTTLSGGAATAAIFSALGAQVKAAEEDAAKAGANFKHSVCHWCFGNIPLDQFCVEVKKMGIESIEILFPNQWETVAKHGLEPLLRKRKITIRS
jgi:hydroxypyruvate isomerase